MENENDTDYLFITNKLERETIYVCGLSLYVSVYEDFQKKFGIYRREESDKPNHFWKVTNYLHETSDVSLFDRVKVIIAFVWKKGTVEYNGKSYDTAMDLLSRMKTDGMIDDAELTYIADKLFGEINKGIKADFEEKENAPK
jgi:hypothetical protein